MTATVDTAGLTALILSGWPLIDEAERVAELLLPQLDQVRPRPGGPG